MIPSLPPPFPFYRSYTVSRAPYSPNLELFHRFHRGKSGKRNPTAYCSDHGDDEASGGGANKSNSSKNNDGNEFGLGKSHHRLVTGRVDPRTSLALYFDGPAVASTKLEKSSNRRKAAGNGQNQEEEEVGGGRQGGGCGG